jgi:hypothetical protein
MAHNADEKNNPDDPERTAVRKYRLTECSQVVGVVVECLRPGEDLEIAVHVGQQIADQDEASDGHHGFERNR